MYGAWCMVIDMRVALTCRPSAMLVSVERMTSAVRKASGSVMRRMAESSRVRSNHCVACVFAAVYAYGIIHTKNQDRT